GLAGEFDESPYAHSSSNLECDDWVFKGIPAAYAPRNESSRPRGSEQSSSDACQAERSELKVGKPRSFEIAIGAVPARTMRSIRLTDDHAYHDPCHPLKLFL